MSRAQKEWQDTTDNDSRTFTMYNGGEFIQENTLLAVWELPGVGGVNPI